MKYRPSSESLVLTIIKQFSRRVDELSNEVEHLRADIRVLRADIEDLRSNIATLSRLVSELIANRRCSRLRLFR